MCPEGRTEVFRELPTSHELPIVVMGFANLAPPRRTLLALPTSLQPSEDPLPLKYNLPDTPHDEAISGSGVPMLHRGARFACVTQGRLGRVTRWPTWKWGRFRRDRGGNITIWQELQLLGKCVTLYCTAMVEKHGKANSAFLPS